MSCREDTLQCLKPAAALYRQTGRGSSRKNDLDVLGDREVLRAVPADLARGLAAADVLAGRPPGAHLRARRPDGGAFARDEVLDEAQALERVALEVVALAVGVPDQ